MTCVDPQMNELLAAYEFGALDGDDKRKFEAHLLECDHCFQSLYEMAPVMEALRQNPGRFLPAVTPWWERIAQRVAAFVRYLGGLIRTGIDMIAAWLRSWLAVPAWRLALAALAVIVAIAFWPRGSQPSLADFAQIEHAPYHAMNIKSGAEVSEAERLFEEGMVFYQQKDYGRAAEKLALAARQDSSDAGLQFYLGLSYLLDKQVDPAIVHLQRAVALGEDSILEKAYWYLGNAWLLKNRRAEALQAFREVVEIEGDYQSHAQEIIAQVERMPD